MPQLHSSPRCSGTRMLRWVTVVVPTAVVLAGSFGTTGAYAAPAFFQAVKARPLLGRVFLSEEYQAGRGPVVVLCNRFWKRRFGADPGSIGRTLQLNGRSFTIVGVMPSTFEFPSDVDLWVPKAE